MRVKKIMVSEEAIGVVRGGMSGAWAELIKIKGEDRYFILFYSCRGALKDAIPVENGAEYLVGPDWVKRVVPLEEDTYWPRRWAREFGNGQYAHTSYFKILKNGDKFQLPLLRGRADEPYYDSTTSLEKLVIKPLNGFSYGVCLVAESWLKHVSYEEFCRAMEKPAGRWGG